MTASILTESPPIDWDHAHPLLLEALHVDRDLAYAAALGDWARWLKGGWDDYLEETTADRKERDAAFDERQTSKVEAYRRDAAKVMAEAQQTP